LIVHTKLAINMIFSPILKILRKNVSIVLFFGFLIFIFASIWISSNQTTNNAKVLVNFAKSSIDEVDASLNKLIRVSSQYKNLESNNQNQLSELNTLATRLQSLSSTIPNKNTDDTSVNLEVSLRKLFTSLKKNTIEPIIIKVQSAKTQYPDFILIEESMLKTKEFTDNISAIQAHLNSVAARFSLS
jgi:inorganic triphosphatase YgiF